MYKILALLPLWMLSSCCLSVLPCSDARGQIKLSEVKTQVWDGFEQPQVVDGKVLSAVTSKPILVDVKTSYLLEKPADYKVQEVVIEAKPNLDFVDVTLVENSPTQSELKFPIGTKGDFRFTLTLKNDKGEIKSRGNLSVANEPYRPIDPILPKPPQPAPTNDVERIVDNAMLEMRRGYATSFKRTADEITAGRLETDDKLQKFMFPITKTAREQAVAGVDGLLQDKMPRDGSKIKPEAAGFLREIAAAFERGIK